MFAAVIVVDPTIQQGPYAPVDLGIHFDLGKTVDLHKIVAETTSQGSQQRRTWPYDSCTPSSSSPIPITGNSTATADTLGSQRIQEFRTAYVRRRSHRWHVNLDELCVHTLAKAVNDSIAHPYKTLTPHTHRRTQEWDRSGWTPSSK